MRLIQIMPNRITGAVQIWEVSSNRKLKYFGSGASRPGAGNRLSIAGHVD